MKILLWIIWLTPVGAIAGNYGPFNAELIRVIDGDTFIFDVQVWPGQIQRASVRGAGIDAPEIKGKCKLEKTLATKAKDFSTNYLKTANWIKLHNIKKGKYYGRVIAEIETNNGKLSDALIKAGLARQYAGGKRSGWCRF